MHSSHTESGVFTRDAEQLGPAGELVLLVDDDPMYRTALARSLRWQGYQVLACAEPGEALARCASQLPGLVISSLDMPSMSGVELAELMGIALGDECPPVLLLTAGSEASAVGPAMQTLSKGLGLDAMLEAIELALSSPLDRRQPQRADNELPPPPDVQVHVHVAALAAIA
jgi:CheY-like chemotaxis protein